MEGFAHLPGVALNLLASIPEHVEITKSLDFVSVLSGFNRENAHAISKTEKLVSHTWFM